MRKSLLTIVVALGLGKINAVQAQSPAPWQLKGEGYVFVLNAPEEINRLDGNLPEDLKASYQNSLSLLMYVRYSDSPVGPYNEILYIPGKFTFPDGKVNRSITRIYVDSKESLLGGQSNWGIPKEMGEFNAEGERISLTIDGRPALSFDLKSFGPSFPVSTRIIPQSLRTLSQLWEGKIFTFALSGEATASLASLTPLSGNGELFPDLTKRKVIVGFHIQDFSINFPVAEITEVSHL